MTRNDAIANLKMIRVAFTDPVTAEQAKLIDDTFDLAVKALKYCEGCRMIEDKMIIGNGGTPLTVADAVIRECADKEWLEDVIYFIKAYIDRTYTAENKAESEDK